MPAYFALIKRIRIVAAQVDTRPQINTSASRKQTATIIYLKPSVICGNPGRTSCACKCETPIGISQSEQLPSGDTLPWRTWRTANRVCSGQATTPAAKHLWGYRENKHCMCGAATCDLNHIMTSCTHFGEIPSKDDIAEMEGRAVRWMSAVADTI